jgi:acyl-CoA thioester hydrolase
MFIVSPHQASTTLEKVSDLELKVRDYECDMDHVVNNAVYLNYLEHARHEFLMSLGIKFGELSRQGVSLVVTRIEADFRASLTSGDTFLVRTSLNRKGRIRLQFNQSIYRKPDNRLMLSAVVTGTALNQRGRPEIPLDLDRALGQSIEQK